MSGTSMDGLDCGLFEVHLALDYHLEWICIDFHTFPYSEDIRGLIQISLQGNDEMIQKAMEVIV